MANHSRWLKPIVGSLAPSIRSDRLLWRNPETIGVPPESNRHENASIAPMKPPCDESVVRSVSADVPCTAQAGRWILAATILGSSMAFIDSTVVNVSLPPLQASLHANIVGVQWVVE